ncbi:MAG: MchE protein, partial [Planctomyces sp.]
MRVAKSISFVGVLFLVGIATYLTRNSWSKLLPSKSVTQSQKEMAAPPVQEVKTLRMTEQARKNLGLVSRPAKPQVYWRTIEVPGEIVDRPGYSDRGVTSPAVGVVTQVHAFPGDTVKPGDRLFTLRLFSEYLQNTQSELFRATREIQLITEQHARLEGLVKSGGVPEARLIELDNQLRRQKALIQSYQQDLLTRGLNPE